MPQNGTQVINPHVSRCANLNSACDEELVAITNILGSATKAKLELIIPANASPGVHGFSMRLAIEVEARHIAVVDAAQCHGNCGILVVFHANIPQSINQGKGIGKLLEKIIVKAAIDCRYSFLLSTTISQMKVAEKLLAHAAWQKQESCSFNNRRSGNQINIWTKRIWNGTKTDAPLFMFGDAITPGVPIGGCVTITGS